MSSRLGTYFSIASISVFDFGLGISIAKITDYIFPAPHPEDSILHLLLTSMAQLVLSMTLSYELRGLLLTERQGFFDPTGGIGFILAVHRMPTFWKRIDLLTNKILDYIFNPILNKPTSQGAGGPLQANNLNQQRADIGAAIKTNKVPQDIISEIKNSQRGNLQSSSTLSSQ